MIYLYYLTSTPPVIQCLWPLQTMTKQTPCPPLNSSHPKEPGDKRNQITGKELDRLLVLLPSLKPKENDITAVILIIMHGGTEAPAVLQKQKHKDLE